MATPSRPASRSPMALRGSPLAAPTGGNTHGGIDRAAFSTSNSGTHCAASRHFPTRLGPPHSVATKATWLPPWAPGSVAARGTQACTSATTCGSGGSREARGSSRPCTASVTARRRYCSVGSSASYAQSARLSADIPVAQASVCSPPSGRASALLRAGGSRRLKKHSELAVLPRAEAQRRGSETARSMQRDIGELLANSEDSVAARACFPAVPDLNRRMGCAQKRGEEIFWAQP
jgi:hypothetical protein